MESKKTSAVVKILLKKLLPLLILVVLILIAVQIQKAGTADNGDESSTVTEVSYPAPNADQYSNKLVAENGNYELYLDGPTLSITIKDKTTGETLESTVVNDDGKNNAQWQGFMKSGIVLNVIDNLNDKVQADFINNASNITIEEIDDGFHAYVAFPDFEFYFEVYVTLKDGALNVEIPDASIIENSEKYHIGAINVFPFLGSTYLGETQGYMFIPDGNGALIYLDDKEGRLTGGYSKMVYGDDSGFADSGEEALLWDMYQTVNDAEKVLAPVFGMVHTSKQLGYLGIIEGGAERASIEAYPNGVVVAYNRIYPKFILRKVYTQPTSQSNSGSIQKLEEDRSHFDIKVKYCLVDGDKANYTGLAVTYRNYLLDQGEIHVKDNTYHTRVDFLGSDKENWLITKRSVTVTTTDDIRNIYSDLGEAGVTGVLSLYKGWQKGGINQLPVTAYKADGSIGGTKDLTKLLKEANASGNLLYLYQDALRINPDENNTTFNVVKKNNKRLYEENTYQTVYEEMLYLTPTRSSYFLNKLTGQYTKKGIIRIALAGISNALFSYSYGGSYYSRSNTMEAYEAAVDKADQSLELVLEQPFSYLWNNTEAFLDMPVGTSDYNFTDEDIPFLSMVLKGILPMYSDYVNFEANEKEFFLKLVETGVYPSFYITEEDSSKLIYTNSANIYSSKYDTYKEQIVKYTKELQAVNDAVLDACIVSHERLDNGVTVVGYSNGINIYINYSSEEQTVNNVVIDAMSYKVGDAQ